jgi:hypothetical protein
MSQIALSNEIGVEVERSIWISAYLRAVRLYDPVDAEAMADEALRRYSERWSNETRIPEGVDREAHLNFRAIMGQN